MSETWTVDREPEQHGDDKSDWIAWLKRSNVHVLVQVGHQATESGAQKIIREFSAATELLEALQLALPILEAANAKCTGETAFIQRIRAAIAKATGMKS